ncbi:MAG: hypothetical protein AB3N14_02195 [Flavobacteriaceae bacterium]
MKNTKRSFATVLFAFLILSIGTNCEQKKKDGDGDEKPEEEVVEPPKQIVELKQAKEIYDTYTRRRAGLIEESEGPKPDGSKFDVARYTYYDYETVKQYMAFIEQEAKKANVKISSLRFYFANYPDSTNFMNGNKVVHPRQNSIFLVPATKKDGLEYPFMVADNDGKWEAVLLTGQLERYGEKGMGMQQEGRPKAYAGFAPNAVLSLDHHEQSLFMNEGGSAPPPYH